MSDTDRIRVSVQDAVASVVFCRPPANALDARMTSLIESTASALAADRSVRAVVFSSAVDGIFMAGADFQAVHTGWDTLPETIANLRRAFAAVESIPAPTIAALGGHTMGGGCELVLCCDLRVMATGAPRIGLPEVRHGLLPGGGGTQRLMRLVRRDVALDLLMRGRSVDAVEAQRIGLVTQACAPAELEDVVGALARELADLPGAAVQAIKHAATRGVDRSLAEGLDLEGALLTELGTTHDAREGVAAFVERRRAVFQHR